MQNQSKKKNMNSSHGCGCPGGVNISLWLLSSLPLLWPRLSDSFCLLAKCSHLLFLPIALSSSSLLSRITVSYVNGAGLLIGLG